MHETRQERKLREIKSRYKLSQKRLLRPSAETRASWYGRDMSWMIEYVNRLTESGND